MRTVTRVPSIIFNGLKSEVRRAFRASVTRTACHLTHARADWEGAHGGGARAESNVARGSRVDLAVYGLLQERANSESAWGRLKSCGLEIKRRTKMHLHYYLRCPLPRKLLNSFHLSFGGSTRNPRTSRRQGRTGGRSMMGDPFCGIGPEPCVFLRCPTSNSSVACLDVRSRSRNAATFKSWILQGVC